MKFRARLLPLFLCVAVLAAAAFIPAAALPPSDEEIFSGIDVSEFQGKIDFERVFNDGVRAVYIRAGVGESYIDPEFDSNYERARAAGLRVGFYHYVTARNVEEGRRQAEFFASLAAGRAVDLRLAMDFEYFGGLSSNEINEISREYLRTLTERTGRQAVIYSDFYNAAYVFSASLAHEYPLWAAQYDADEPGDNGKWDSWAGFQYTDEGRVDGIAGYVDRDMFTRGILMSDRSVIDGEKRMPERSQQRRIIVYVRAGDTLWSIAREYETTVRQIARENNILNPNLIFVGERLVITLPARREGEDIYVVRRGDTLTSIAGRFGVSVSAIAQANSVRDVNLIRTGERLRIPAAETSGAFYAVRKGDTLSRIAAAEGVRAGDIAGINLLKNPNLVKVGERLKLYEKERGSSGQKKY